MVLTSHVTSDKSYPATVSSHVLNQETRSQVVSSSVNTGSRLVLEYGKKNKNRLSLILEKQKGKQADWKFAVLARLRTRSSGEEIDEE